MIACTRRSLAGVLLTLAWAVPAAMGATGATMTVKASSLRAGAGHVRLTVELKYEMQCNYPGAAPVVLTLPGRVPATIAASAVLVNGKPARDVSVQGRQVTVALRPPPQILCDLIGPGTLTVELTSRAGIANPATPGIYRVTARKGVLTFSAPLKITAG